METKLTSTDNSLTSISISSTIYDCYASTLISQEYTNSSEVAQELVLIISLDKDSVLKQLMAKIGEGVLVSKIFSKDNAEEKYSDSISSGNTAVIGNLGDKSPDDFVLSIGNLNPGVSIKIDVEIIQIIKVDDLSYQYVFPLLRIPLITANKKPLYDFMCLKKLEKEGISETKFVPVTFNAVFISPSRITRFTSINHKGDIKISDDKKIAELLITPEQLSSNPDEIKILFRNDDLNSLRLYEEYDPKINKYSYLLRYKMDERQVYPVTDECDVDPEFNYYENYEQEAINDYPATFIFLLDQSGSMSGTPIDTAKEALKLFIKSLPPDSEFSIIGFGSSFKDYMGVLKYNEQNVNQAIKLINSLTANLGGTEIYRPLEYIYDNYSQCTEYFLKNVFLLTDGCVNDPSSVTDLIRKNNSSYRVHSFGIGTQVSVPFVTKCGENGRGSFNFARELKDIAKCVISALNLALKPYYSNLDIAFSSEVKPEIEYPEKKNNKIIYQDDLFTYGFVSSERLDPDTVITFTAEKMKEPVKKEVKARECLVSLLENNVLSKFIAGFYCKLAGTVDHNIVNISKQYQVLSKETSLFLEFENETSTSTGLKQIKMQSVQEIPHKINTSIKQTTVVSKTGKHGAAKKTVVNSTIPIRSPNILIKSPALTKCLEVKSSDQSRSRVANLENESLSLVMDESTKRKKKKCDKNSLKLLNVCQFDEEEAEFEESLNLQSFEKCDKKYSPQSSNTNNSLSSSTSNISEHKFTYQSVVSLQTVTGEWSSKDSGKEPLRSILSSSKSTQDLIVQYLAENKLSVDDYDIIITCVVIWYLLTYFQEFKDEFFLITNKAKKFLLGKGVNYTNLAKTLK